MRARRGSAGPGGAPGPRTPGPAALEPAGRGQATPRRAATALAATAALLVALLLAAWPRPAAAQAPRPDSEPCRQQCGATMPRRIDHPASIQTCLLRCQALEGRGRAPFSPPAPGAGPEARGTAPPPRPPQRPRPAEAAGGTATPPPGATPPASAGTGSRAAAARAPAAPGAAAPRYGAIYLAAAPSARFGLVAGQADRIAAHRRAESQCMGTDGTPCRLALEFQERCGSVAHGVSGRSMVVTDDPSTYLVMLATAASGRSAEEAEREAVADCRLRHRNAQCRVVRTQCGPAAPG